MKKKKNSFQKKTLRNALMISLIAVCLTGCGDKNEWGEDVTFGDVDVEAEVVDQNDFDVEWEIDHYISFTEQNQSETPYTFDNYRLYYNKVADQLGLMLLKEYEMTSESSQEESIVYQFSDSISNNYLTVQNGKVTVVNFEYSADFYDEENYNLHIAECMPAIYGGVPYLKKYDLNKIFLELSESLEKERGMYSTEFNGISIVAKREYNLVKISIYKK